MIKEAIEKIEAMSRPTIWAVGDHTYSLTPDGSYREIHEDLFSADTIQLNSLDALCKMILREGTVPGWDAETKLTFERAAVALQTRFQDSEDRAYTLQLLSQITTGAKITYNDIGVATTIVTQKGVSLQANATIRPLVRLRPYRTFQEIEQPLGLFLIRIDERGISFVEADGGMWKLEARKTIKEYLEEHLADEIEAGRVTVML